MVNFIPANISMLALPLLAGYDADISIYLKALLYPGTALQSC